MEPYRRLLLAIRTAAKRHTRVCMRNGQTFAVVHWWPDRGVVEVDVYDNEGVVADVHAFDARTLRDAISTRQIRAPWAQTARHLLSNL